MSDRGEARGLTLRICGHTVLWTSGAEGKGDAVGPFKTPCLCEDHLSLRPVTMATGCAQCTKKGGDWGQKPWQHKLSQQPL